MSNYTKATDFAAKDALPSGDAAKVIKGSEFEDEFDAIATAVNSKADTASPTFTGTVTAPTVDINGGNIDGTVIGGTTAATGSFTTGSFSGTVSFADNAKVSVGTGSDLEIYHDGSNSYITEQGDGSLIIKSNGDGIVFRNSIGSNYASMLESTGQAKLFHISGGIATSRLTTSATGIDVNGDTSTDTLTLGLWTIKVDTNELVFVYNSTEVFKVGTNGAITSADNVTAYGTI